MTFKKYKSDQVIKPLLIFLFISPAIAEYLYHDLTFVIGLILFAATAFIGVCVHRFYIEGEKKLLIYSTISLTVFYLFTFFEVYLLRMQS